jgi:hypothetical protein
MIEEAEASIKKDARLESVVDGVFAELTRRGDAAADAYPFAVERKCIRVRDAGEECTAYRFLLLLSYLCIHEPARVCNPWRKMFERLATHALRTYLGDGAEALNTGWPRDDAKSFPDAIRQVIAGLREGRDYQERAGGSPKDDTVDIVGWRHFPDKQTGKLVVLGNCATGSDFGGVKARDLAANRFFRTWFAELPQSPYVYAYFVPHLVQYGFDWNRLVVAVEHSQLFFDRCRVAYCTRGLTADDTRTHEEWTCERLRELSQDIAS